MDLLTKLYLAMVHYEGDCKGRIQHFTKVHNYAHFIGKAEGLDEKTQFILEASAIVHDCGIKAAIEKFGSGAGKLQESEGKVIAYDLLASLGFEEEVCQRVSYLVGHHHTYENVDGLDYRILLEADALVNLQENDVKKDVVEKWYRDVFETTAGKEICQTMYGLE